MDLIRTFANPPQKIVTTLQLVYLILNDDKEPANWQNIRIMLQDLNTLFKKIINLQPESISDIKKAKINKFIQDNQMNEADYVEKVQKASCAAGNLCDWALALVK